jgi:glycine/D-amino acid oxidase-like deaminating enzyme
MDADVIVVGGGLAVLVATHELTSRGKKVAVIDQRRTRQTLAARGSGRLAVSSSSTVPSSAG